MDSVTTARRSFTELLLPGMMALITALVSFATLTLIPIPMIQELAIIATMGVAYKVISNLVMLPVVASYFKFDPAYMDRSERRRRWRQRAMMMLGHIAETRYAAMGTVLCVVVVRRRLCSKSGSAYRRP